MNLALAAPPVLIALNPFLAPLVYEHATYLLHRFLLNIPALTVTSLMLGIVVGWGRRGNVPRKVVAVAFLFVWARLFLVAAGAWVADMRTLASETDGAGVTGALARAIEFVERRIPKDAVVLSDPVTSFAVSAFTNADVVAVLGQHGNPNDRHAVARLAAIRTALSPYTTQVETMLVVRRFHVDYVMINGSFNGPIHEFMADWDPAFADVVGQKFGSLERAYRKIYDADDIRIFEVVGTEIHRITWHPVVPFIGEPPEGLDACEGWPADRPVEVTGIKIEPRVALPGETVTVTVGYRRADDRIPDFPMSLHLRFEARDYLESARKYPGDKYVRRYRERREGAFRRFRISRRVFNGYFPVREWPWTEMCHEQFEVRLPTDLLETVYEVQCLITEDTLLPNFALADFVYNDDSYVGTPCTEIRVRKFVTR